jgi:Flp pilus assembly pilin Flp
LIAAFIGIGIIVSLGPLKTALNALFNNVKANVSGKVTRIPRALA